MRLYAITAVVVTAAALVGFGGSSAFADTTNNNAGSSASAQNNVTVQAGEYLAEIAAKNNTTYVRIYDANQQVQNPDLIFPGEVLRIPSATEQLPNRQLPGQVQPSASTSADVQASAPISSTDSDSDSAATVAAPAPVVQQTSVQAPAVASGSVWDELAQCESSGNWSINTGNGFYGGLQFTLSSWQSVGGTGYPNQASREEQIMRAEKLQSMQGWGAWPVCSAKLGL